MGMLILQDVRLFWGSKWDSASGEEDKACGVRLPCIFLCLMVVIDVQLMLLPSKMNSLTHCSAQFVKIMSSAVLEMWRWKRSY